MSVRVLLIGNLFDHHISRFIKNLHNVNDGNVISVDIFSIYYNTNRLPKESKFFKDIFLLRKHFPNFLYNKVSLKVLYVLDLIFSFKEIKNKYEIINIHYITFVSFYLWSFYRKIASKIVVTPWGSDVLRQKFYKRKLVNTCLKWADYITLDDSEDFNNSITENLKLNPSCLVKTGFGSDIIDLHIKLGNLITQEYAKKVIGYQNKFIITCGYNANPAQNHIQIIKALYQIKQQLPQNTILFFTFTYGRYHSYVNELKELLEKFDFEYVFFTNYLSDKKMVILQKSTDLFIHVQITDGFSASLQEYILSGATIINGKWLKYPTLEQYGKPYFEIQTLDNLPYVLLNSIKEKITIPEKLTAYLSEQGWIAKIELWKRFYLTFSN